MLAMNYEKLAEVVVAFQSILRRHAKPRTGKRSALKPVGIVRVVMVEENFNFLFPGSLRHRRSDGSYQRVQVSTTNFFGLLARVKNAPHRWRAENGNCCFASGPIFASLSRSITLVDHDHSSCRRCQYSGSLEGLSSHSFPINAVHTSTYMSFLSQLCSVTIIHSLPGSCGCGRKTGLMSACGSHDSFVPSDLPDQVSDQEQFHRPHSASNRCRDQEVRRAGVIVSLVRF